MGQNMALDSLRLEHENDRHWKHRRHFIEVNVQDFADIDHLVSLSMTWANMKFLGCRYEPELMLRVASMAEKMDPIDESEEAAERKEKPRGEVVLPEDNAGFKLMQKMGWSGSGLGKEGQGITQPIEAVQKPARHGLGREVESGRVDRKNGRTQNQQGNLSNVKRMKTRKGGKETAPKPWQANKEHCESEPLDVSMSAEVYPVLGKFVNIECSIDNAIGTLHASARLNQKTISFEHELLSPKEHEVLVYLEGLLIGKAVCPTQKEAKREAAEQGLELLKSLYPTVIKKSLYECTEELKGDEIKVTDICSNIREESAEGANPSEQAQPEYVLPDHNAGFKLLQKMGWKGEGLGKEEQGRTAPVIPEMLPKRAGLGIDLDKHKDTEGNIVTRDMDRMVIYQLLQEVYMGERELLTFSSSLTKGERANIHQMCTKLGLRSQSIGKGADRRLTIRCKMNKKQLHALAQGGSQLFELEGPGGWQY